MMNQMKGWAYGSLGSLEAGTERSIQDARHCKDAMGLGRADVYASISYMGCICHTCTTV